MRRWWLVVGAVVLAACTSAHDSPAFPAGAGAYAAVTSAPDGWTVERSGRSPGTSFGSPGTITVFTPEGRPGTRALVAATTGRPWPTGGQTIAVSGAVDDREARLGDQPGHLWVHVADEVVEVWGRRVGDAELRRFAGRVGMSADRSPSLAAPLDGFDRLASLPPGWLSNGTATEALLRHRSRRVFVGVVSLPRDQIAALRLVLVADPALQFATIASVYGVASYPKAATRPIGARTAFEGMLTPEIAVLVVPGDPGVAVLLSTTSGEHAARDLPLVRRVAEHHLQRVTAAQLDDLTG